MNNQVVYKIQKKKKCIVTDGWGVLIANGVGGVVVNDLKSIMQPDATDFNYSPSPCNPVII